VTELRHESASYRKRAADAEAAAKAAQDAAEKAKADAEAAGSKAAKDAEARVIRAEVKALAIKAGIVDIDGLQLADLSGVAFDDKGNLAGATEALDALKKAKPYLFTTTTASTTGKPPADTKGGKSVRDMSPEEYAKERRRLGLR
jgi:membrane protein involved in colicin uptake